MGDVWICCLISTILFFALGRMAYRVVRRVTESDCKEKPIILTEERTRLLKYIIWLLLPVWIFYEGYIIFWSDISWVEDLFTNLFAAAVVLYLQEIRRVDENDCGLWLYALFGFIFLVVGNSDNAALAAYKTLFVPMGVGVIIWVAHEYLKNYLEIKDRCTTRLKYLFRREKKKLLQEENNNENLIN